MASSILNMLVAFSLASFWFLSGDVSAQVMTGAAQTEIYLPLLKGKRVGVVANRASVIERTPGHVNVRQQDRSGSFNHGESNWDLVNLVDTLLDRGVNVKKVFCPEHGFRITSGAGEHIQGGVDQVTGLPVISLYGKHRKPTPEDLKGLDLVLFDLQDVGVRFYTYISTLTLVMEACSEAGIPVIILDRPNPNGFYIDGPVLEEGLESFVGMHPVPVVYGMTIGEYGKMVNGEGWMKDGVQCYLTVIPLKGWNHGTYVDLPLSPSPNLSTTNAIYLYPSLCFFEGTTVSVGRGTDTPFEVFGHPGFKGFSFVFTPRSIPGKSMHPKHEGKACYGLNLEQFYQQQPGMFGRINLSWLMMSFKLLGYDPEIFNNYFDNLAGTRSLKKQIIAEVPESEIRAGWQEGISQFKKIREKYLLYE